MQRSTLLHIVVLSSMIFLVRPAGAQSAIMDVTDRPVPVTRLGEKPHVEGETRWTDFVAQMPNDACSSTGSLRKMLLGDDASPEPRADAVANCVESQIRVQNTSARPIHCFVTSTLPTADDRRKKKLEGDLVIYPGNIETLVSTVGSKASTPRKFDMNCQIYPTTYEALTIEPGCKLTLKSVPNPDDFFPPGSKRREEKGDAVLDFLVDIATQRMVDIHIASSTGFQDLDNAAIKVGKASRANSSCANQRYRIKVKFKIEDDEEPPPADMAPAPLQPEPPQPKPDH